MHVADPTTTASTGQFIIQVLLATGVAGLVTAIANAFLSRKKTTADVAKTTADTEKTTADAESSRIGAAAVLTGSAVQLLQRMDGEVTALRARVTEQDAKIGEQGSMINKQGAAIDDLQKTIRESQQRERGHVRQLTAYRRWIEVASRLLVERGIPIDPPPHEEWQWPALPPAESV